MRQCVAVSLGKTLNAISILGLSSLLVVMAQPDERHANRTDCVLERYDSTQHSTTSGSNEEVADSERPG